jgi:hypothetical protein
MKVFVSGSIKEFEELLNRKDIKITFQELKAVEQSYAFQDYVMIVAIYEEL